jgi:hypothetical protein
MGSPMGLEAFGGPLRYSQTIDWQTVDNGQFPAPLSFAGVSLSRRWATSR